MRAPRAYIVRIYRRGYRCLAGTVEDTASSRTRSFRSIEELLGLLGAPIRRSPAPRTRPRAHR